MKFSPSRNELVVICRGVVISARNVASGESVTKQDVPECLQLELNVGMVLTVVSVTRTIPNIATVRVPVVREGKPQVITAKIPVNALKMFTVPVLVPVAPGAAVVVPS